MRDSHVTALLPCHGHIDIPTSKRKKTTHGKHVADGWFGALRVLLKCYDVCTVEEIGVMACRDKSRANSAVVINPDGMVGWELTFLKHCKKGDTKNLGFKASQGHICACCHPDFEQTVKDPGMITVIKSCWDPSTPLHWLSMMSSPSATPTHCNPFVKTSDLPAEPPSPKPRVCLDYNGRAPPNDPAALETTRTIVCRECKQHKKEGAPFCLCVACDSWHHPGCASLADAAAEHNEKEDVAWKCKRCVCGNVARRQPNQAKRRKVESVISHKTALIVGHRGDVNMHDVDPKLVTQKRAAAARGYFPDDCW